MQCNTQRNRPQNPGLHANPVSALFFLYLVPVFYKNFRKELSEEDLFEVLDEHKSSNLGDQLEDAWNLAHKKHKTYTLHRSLGKLFYKEFLLSGLLQGVKDIFAIILVPYAVGKLVAYFGNATNNISKSSAYIYATAIVLTLLMERVLAHTIWMWIKHLSMKMRVSCCSLVYRKSLRLSLKALHQTNIGHIINLLSNDASKFDIGFVLIHYLWVAPLQVAISTCILYYNVGISVFTGMAFILLFIPLQIYLGKRNSLVRLRTALRTDERVRLMNEILSGIQIIKMYNWEKPFAKLISLARRFEMKSIRLHFYIESIVFSLDMFVARTSIFITIIVYLVLEKDINADIVYSVSAMYNLIRPVVTIIFSLAIAFLGEAHISILRLDDFLSFEEVEGASEANGLANKSIAIKSNGYVQGPRILLENVNAKWVDSVAMNTLSQINLTIDKNQLVAVVGPVGSGKSSLLNVLLNEVPYTTGRIEIKGKVSYASQEAWLFLGSVRQNILFGDPYDEERYQKVVKVCALEPDFKILPYGDRTIIREKGKSLSGGQKARISLARSVYKEADIYLLDDPLSAVDTKVGKKLYDKCIKEYLKDKICILITHQLQYLQNADKIIVLNNGSIAASGSYDELQSNTFSFSDLLKQNTSNNEKHDSVSIKSSVSDNLDTLHNNENDDIEVDEEAVATGSLGILTYRDYFRKGGNWFVILCVVLMFVISHLTASGGDYFVSQWINLEQQAHKEQNNTNITIDKAHVIYAYTGITSGTIILGLIRTTAFFLFFVHASKQMHDTIFERIVHATMNFFNYNPTGRILNRFSKDMGIVDEYIPMVLFDVVDVLFVLIATIILSCIVNLWFSLPCAGLLFVLYLIRVVYIQTSRQVKRIEGTTRSPIYNHASASLAGLTTIRAYNAQQLLIKEYDNIQDKHNSAWYLYISSSEAFGLWIDVTCITFIGLIVYSFLLVDIGYYGGDVGLVITIYIALAGTLQWGIFQWSELENNMTSVERILEYDKIETEPKRPPISNIPRDWPEFGKVVFDNVSMQYESNEAPVLKNLNFVINPGEKIGIVGRTGAGKTSTISALFQFYPLSGRIIIDDVDTTKLPLDFLRSKISIIPQECVLFSGTMRKNLDPFDEYNDDILWDALEQVEMKSVIEEIPGGLSSSIMESGGNFSVGQRQLICLARAIIRNNKIILMDEATANIDSYTDALIQKTIKRNFANCTIMTVAHRLHTIMDSDKVLVLDQGSVEEFDAPYLLLQKENGIFESMVQTTGSSAAQQLCSIAEESYNLKLT